MSRGKRRKPPANPAEKLGSFVGAIIGTLIGLWFLYIVADFLWTAFWQPY